MSIYRTINPTEFDDVDGIIINEVSPSANIQGVAANTAILVGEFQRGPVNALTLVGSTGELHEIYGKSTFSGNLQLNNKKFGILKIIRAAAAAAVKATKTFKDAATPTPLDSITFTALYQGVYGNSLKVTIEAGSTSGRKYTFQDTNADAVLSQEVYDNIVVTAKTQADLDVLFAGSRLVVAVKAATTATAEPAVASATALASGAEGSIADTDYQTAIAIAEQEKAGNVLWTDKYNSTIKGYLKAHVASSPDKMVIISPDSETVTYSSAITEAGSNRDTDGRIIYAFNHLKTNIGGLNVWQSPAPWVASIISNTSPHIDPAFAENVKFTLGASDVYNKLSRANFIALKDAGISSFEFDADLGIKLKSSVTTQIVSSSKVTILRRRMADYLQDSIAYFLKNYQNAVNSASNRKEVKAAIIGWDNSLILNGILPGDSEVKDGLARIVDSESLNTSLSIGLGMFKLLYKRRIYSSMRYIVLTCEVGENVVVSQSE